MGYKHWFTLDKKKYSAIDLVKIASGVLGGQGGGGRPDMAQTGGNDTSRFDEAIAEIRNSL